MADDPAKLATIGNAILAQVPEGIRPDWVAYIASYYDREEHEPDAQLIGRWWKYEQVLNPLRTEDQRTAEVPLRDWSLSP